jgi:hypothetical protein
VRAPASGARSTAAARRAARSDPTDELRAGARVPPAREHEQAARLEELVETRGCPPPVCPRATEALAIHHEHRDRDLGAARAFGLESGELAAPRPPSSARTAGAVERKMTWRDSASLNLE